MPRTEKYDHQGVFRPDLAQTVAAAAPLTLTDGAVLNSRRQSCRFAFSGRRRQFASTSLRPQYRDFEPRFGFAWSPSSSKRTT